MGRQTTNYKRRAIFQLQEIVKNLKEKEESPSLIKKINKIKSTIEKIRDPQTSHTIKKKKDKK